MPVIAYRIAVSLDDTPRCWPRLYEPPPEREWPWRLCARCGRGTVRRDLYGVPHCHGPLPEEPRGWVLTQPEPVEYVKDATGIGKPPAGGTGG